MYVIAWFEDEFGNIETSEKANKRRNKTIIWKQRKEKISFGKIVARSEWIVARFEAHWRAERWKNGPIASRFGSITG